MSATLERRRSKFAFGEKQERVNLFPLEGRKLLFVPSRRLWKVHHHAYKARLWRRRPPITIEDLAKETFTPLATIKGHRLRLGKPAWFDSWLKGQGPAEVKVATLTEIQRMKKFCDYVVHCRTAGLHDLTYRRWFRLGAITNLEWLKWLYGFSAPAGVFIVKQGLRRLKKEMARKAIAMAARVPKKVMLKWYGDPQLAELLSTLVKQAGMHSDLKALLESDPYRHWDPTTKKRMIRYARAATVAACLARARLGNTQYRQYLREADQMGARQELENYLKSTDVASFRKAGLWARNLFLPSDGMETFREVAVEVGSANLIKQVVAPIDGFDKWFSTWTLPKGFSFEEITNNGTEGNQRKLPAREKHLKWRAMRQAGKSWAKIAQLHFAETQEKVTKDAVRKALARL